MKILIITENFKTGGLETQIMGFCRYLRSSGHEVHLISGIGSRTFPLREIIGDNILEVDMRPDISPKEAMESINRIVTYVEEKGADFLHLHPFTSFIYGGIAASIANKPYVVTLHGPRSLPYGYNATYRIFIELILRDAWRIFCVSKEIAERVKAIIPEGNVRTLPNGVDPERFKPTPRDPAGPIALISRIDIDKIKGIKSFLSDWSKLPRDLRRPVHIFGAGNSFEELKKWVKDLLDEESWITFMGHEDRIDKRLKTGYSAVAGMGRVVIEAGAMNLPVILIGYDGPIGLVSLENCPQLFCRNFSGRYAPIIGIEKIQDELWALDILPERFLFSAWVLKNVDEKDIVTKYLKHVENIQLPDYKWREPFLSSIGETNDTSLFGDKVFHCLLANLPQDQSNCHWVNLYLSDKITRKIVDNNVLDSQLNRTIAEKEVLAGQLAQVSSEKEVLAGQLAQITSEKEGQAQQLAQIISEKNILRDQLNNIYLSDFWKIANFYYRMKDSSLGLRGIHKALKGGSRKIINNLYIGNISKFIAYAKRSGFRQTLRRKYEGLKAPRNPFHQTYVKIDLDEALRRGKDNQGIVIYPPTIDWNHTLFQRPHHIMLGLSRKGFTTIFCTPNQIDSLKSDFVSLEENLFLCSKVDALLKLSGRNDLILYISNTMHKPLIEKLRPAKVIYDYIDELEVFSNYDSEMVITHEELLKNADIVLVTADRLFQKVQKIREDAILCPNAVDYWHFADAQLKGPRPFDFKQRGLNSRPIIGYYGALAEWIDYDLLAKAAKKRPNYDFVLIGLDYDGSLFKSSAMTIPNVHYFGPKQYIELPQYLRYFDVAIIPFKLNKISHSTSPLKLFEYMSALKPVVTTAMDELKKYSCIFIAQDSDEFVNLLDKALSSKTDPKYREILRQEALKNTWDIRVNTIIRQLKQLHSRRALIEHNEQENFSSPFNP